MSGQKVLQIADLFQVLPHFKDLDTATLHAVTRSAIHRTYEANQIILLEGEPAIHHVKILNCLEREWRP